jgi:hypothetical protein
MSWSSWQASRVVLSRRYWGAHDPYIPVAMAATSRDRLQEICGAEGRFHRASGRITSNFVVSDDGEITDHQLGVVFVADRPKEEP